MGQAEENLAVITRFVAGTCAEMSDEATFASLRCAIEKLTGFIVLFRSDYSLADGEAVLLDDQSGTFELFFNPVYSQAPQNSWRNRKRIAHELFHVLWRAPIPISQCYNLAGTHPYDEDDLANAFAALMEVVRPAVAARMVKTPEELSGIVQAFRTSPLLTEQKAAAILDSVVAQVGTNIAFARPLYCGVQHHPVSNDYYHKTHHNIPPGSVWS